MGFTGERIEDLKTAVSEACLNAIEHGNKMDAGMKVGIILNVEEKNLQVTVQDAGEKIGPSRYPESRKRLKAGVTAEDGVSFLLRI